MSLLDEFPHRCTIQRRKRSNDRKIGNVETRIVEQTDVECWEMQASASEIKDYERKGMKVSKKIFFASNPNVTERHEIVITKRNGVAVPTSSQVIQDVSSEAREDASAGLGVVWRVMTSDDTGNRT